ncbi:MAG: quinone-dependent dihydroorotate dehydrogenase, partial [Rikenellaceae bacterium]|nr:quinone-dependent dihydroorotate dehydrogenase [Rikenellaceae bacterium]
MYKSIIRPLLFSLFSPETIHHLTVNLIKLMGYLPAGRWFTGLFFTVRHPALEREVFGIHFDNPVGLAAGFDKNAEVYGPLAAFGFGHVEVGTVTPRPQPGNPKPRLFRLVADNAIINRMGFNNGGMEKAQQNLHRRRHSVVGINLGKNTLTPNEAAAADYLKVFRTLYDKADYFVVNVSCPNVAKMACLQQKDNLTEIIAGLVDFRRGQNDYRPILLKISPDL